MKVPAAKSPSGFVTRTSRGPSGFGGVVQVTWVPAPLTTTPVQATPPTVTLAAGLKPLPVMVIGVPPLVGPLVGLTEVSVGGVWTSTAPISQGVAGAPLGTGRVKPRWSVVSGMAEASVQSMVG